MRLLRLLILTLSFIPLHAITSAATMPVLPPHPRLLAHAADWDRLKSRLAAEPDLAAYHEALIVEATRMLPEPPLERIQIGRRLLDVSRELMRRVALWGYAWQTTGDVAFARRAEQEMLAAARFTDWNPSHFLDVGEATTALALGYDWTHAALTPAARAEIAAAILNLGLRPGLDPAVPHNRWHTAKNNWSQVCFGGLTLGALAIGDEFPEVATQVLALARAGIGHGLKPYAPDGVYPEGPTYWGYGTSFQVLMIAGLESALGDDWDLRAAPGFLASAGAYRQTVGPTGLTYNFSDGNAAASFQPILFWFALVAADPGLAANEIPALKNPRTLEPIARRNRFATFATLWWPQAVAPAPRLPLDWHGDGENPLVVFRESWTDPAAAYLAAKGGAAELNHGHMDAGSFIYEADGVRWALDLGLQSYESLESKGHRIFGRTQDAWRWNVYRLNNYSHNTLTFDGKLHRVDGHAKVERFSAEAGRRLAILDLSPVFAGQAGRVRRGFEALPDRGFIVQDEITGLTAGHTIRWQMATRAEVSLDGATATLTQTDRTLTVRVLAPAGAVFSVAPATPPNDYDAPNPGVRLLGLDLTAADSPELTIAVQLSPGEAAAFPPPDLLPLAAW